LEEDFLQENIKIKLFDSLFDQVKNKKDFPFCELTTT
jgi:hypothetical protein